MAKVVVQIVLVDEEVDTEGAAMSPREIATLLHKIDPDDLQDVVRLLESP